ncbi:HAMP domain-containing protein [Aerophototrophica crusticola]|uniref:HAMP domain-containing protein n=1 Tax=Aerophototrophica crusticola TaxID=1709002 RepID=A0A858R509_9PROT|nr:HAMP domain-containing protein [Rhodospirillaceae bacterium B3]
MDRGKASRLSSLRGLSAAITVVAVLVVGGLAAAAAFHLAWFGKVQSALLETPGDAQAKARLLDGVRDRLGHGGFLQNLALFAETGSADAKAAMGKDLEAAEQSLRGFEATRLTPTESQLAADLKRLLETYRQALAAAGDRPQALGGGTGVALLTRHAALADRIAELRRAQSVLALDRLEATAARGFWLGTGAVAALLALLAAVLVLVHARVLRPLAELGTSVAAVAKGDWRSPVWGTTRGDEFGELARAVDGFREAAAEVPDISVLTDGGRMRLKFEGDYADLFEALSARLRGAGGTLAVLGTDVGRMVTDTKTQLTDTLSQVNNLCTAAVRTVSESNREVRQATEILAHAVSRIRAFEAEGPGGGLDGVVETLRRHADTLAETLSTAGEQVDSTMRSLSGSDGQMRAASAQAREAAQGLMASMGEAQSHLLSAVKLLKASGELLSNSAEQTGNRLARAAEAVDAGEKALVAALGAATERLDSATAQASARLEDAGTQVARAADLLEDRTAGLNDRFDIALDGMARAQTIMESSADLATHKLEPLADQMEQVQAGYEALLGDISARSGEMADAVDALRRTGQDLRAEFERRKVEPGQQEAMADLLARMRGSAAQIADRVQEIGGTAQRLAQTLAGGVDDATARLRDVTGDLRQEARSLMAGATEATDALARTAVRQEQVVEGLKSLSDELAARREDGTPERLLEVAAGLSAATDAVHALVASTDSREADSVRDALALVASLKDRLDHVEGVAAGLGAATEAVHALIASGEEKRGAEELAAIAEALRDRLAAVERLGERLDGSADAVKLLVEANRQRESTDLAVITDLAQNLRERVLRLDGLSVDLSRSIDGLRNANRQSEAANAQATRDLGNRLAQIAEQLRGSAVGM